MESIAIFADVQNIYYTVRDIFQAQFNYQSFWKEATAGREVISAFAYAINSNNEKQERFQNALRKIGFEVKLKPYIQRKDGSAKGDWDVGITIDILDVAPTTDKIILLSGDGDFSILVDTIREKYNITVEVYGVRALTAGALINSASHYREINKTLLI